MPLCRLHNNTATQMPEAPLRCPPILPRARSSPLDPVRVTALALFTASALFLTGCHESGDGTQPSVELRNCRIKGVDTEVRCGDIEVPERRPVQAGASSRRIKIHFAVIRALVRGKALDPIFVFAGGPGQAATSVGGLVQPLFSRLNRERDLVLVDQRGTGDSNPLQCDLDEGPSGIEQEQDPQRLSASLATCAAKLTEKGNDLTQYTTTIAVQDYDDVRRALGYAHINLWGASYGTRAALEYLRQFPDRVRTATLDGMAPATMKLPIASAFDADQALDELIHQCRADSLCNRRTPNLATRVDGMFARLAQGPIRTNIVLPLTGQSEALNVTRSLLSSWVREPLYSPITASLVPELIARAALDDFNPLLAASQAVSGDVSNSISFGMHLSVICSEDMASVTAADVAGLERTRFGTSFYDKYKALCAQWPVEPVPAAFFRPVRSNAPVLLLSGGLDPATPPHYADQVLADLPRGRNLVAPNLGHGVSLQGCAPDLIDRFIRTKDASVLNPHCLEAMPRPPFFSPVVPGHS